MAKIKVKNPVVEMDGDDVLGRFRRGEVGREHPPAAVDQVPRRCGAEAARGAGDDHIATPHGVTVSVTASTA